ncbi:uncharacterized protein LOC104885472 [Beta vulgaris subsp. vulgaris]|uniref:uncharacterized protein LOC104885472 n=1 Tax=Beta vulgaris subsp. vulgaris TaxID=3555 RepID=UPI002546B1FE|nr:uncharacterized protein LOC104885472 [Beta vulgaris subsp. vulgaris]
MIEAERLSFLRHNQQSLRAANVKNLRGAVERGETEGSSTGSRIVLPSSFTGGHSYMRENYQDAMAICRWYGYPDLFITFTLVYTVQFQKRDLSARSILLFMHQGDKYPVASDIDKIICAELPDKCEDPELYQAVSEYMMHDPCGSANTNAPCMIDNNAVSIFPRDLHLTDDQIESFALAEIETMLQSNGSSLRKCRFRMN